MNLPRQYQQLHRDTTVQSLTQIPSISNGVITWADSPLVRAAKNGHVLVLDEVDKAPLEVVAILKALIEDGQMLLSDGRRIVSSRGDNGNGDDPTVIRLHSKFRVVCLANPGDRFPFMGNDFFSACGDLFSCISVANPDAKSQLLLLKEYAPRTAANDLERLELIVDCFQDLKKLVNEGTITYPYSTREMVNVVRHLEKYPEDGLTAALANVFAFDKFDTQVTQILTDTFRRRGIPLG